MGMKDVARKVLSHKALAYYASASDEELSKWATLKRPAAILTE